MKEGVRHAKKAGSEGQADVVRHEQVTVGGGKGGGAGAKWDGKGKKSLGEA